MATVSVESTERNPVSSSPHLNTWPVYVPVDGDIGDRNTAAKILDTAVSKFGKIDVMINMELIIDLRGLLMAARNRNRLPSNHQDVKGS